METFSVWAVMPNRTEVNCTDEVCVKTSSFNELFTEAHALALKSKRGNAYVNDAMSKYLCTVTADGRVFV